MVLNLTNMTGTVHHLVLTASIEGTGEVQVFPALPFSGIISCSIAQGMKPVYTSVCSHTTANGWRFNFAEGLSTKLSSSGREYSSALLHTLYFPSNILRQNAFHSTLGAKC